MGGVDFHPDTPETRKAFNELARHKMILKLLTDIRADLVICELEGWDKTEYINMILERIGSLRKE